MSKFYITTAIPYVNAPPHIGHALEFVQADTIARYYKLKGYDTFLVTGADENSLKNIQKAAEQNIGTRELCDRNSALLKDFSERIGLSYNAFIRSSDKEIHWAGTRKLWNMCFDAGDIYKKTYKGLYCVGCEAFYTETELVDGLCPDHLKSPKIVNEENYFFRLSRYEEKLKELIESGKLKITPITKKNEIMAFIDQGLEDFSISRPNERSKGWGIPVPNDEFQTIYVWFDALTVYLTGIGFGRDNNQFNRFWPADMHVIGKGVSRFHAVYWPAILMSAGLETPKEIMIHGYVTSDGHKMSKSLGNVVDPVQMIEKYGKTPIRYYLLKNIPTFGDGDFSEEGLINTINNELVGNLGNFIYRTMTFIYKNYGGIVEADGLEENDKKLMEKVDTISRDVEIDILKSKLSNGLVKIMSLSALGNKYIQDNKPWELLKNDKTKCQKTLFVSASICRTLSILLYPFLPDMAERLSKLLNITINSFSDAKTILQNTIKINKPEILFQKIDRKKE